jgi:hypothetical protein
VIALLALAVALVAEDATVLRASPRAGAPAQAQLWRGEWLEVRGEEAGWLKVYDHRRERPGYVRSLEVRVHAADASEGPALRAVVAFLRDAPGFESLGIGYAALALRCDADRPAPELHAAIGAMAERVARRASMGRNPNPVLAAHREVLESYGVKLVDLEREGRVQVCYDGAAFRQVLGSVGAAADDRARAALALTQSGCIESGASPLAIKAWNEWRLDVLGSIGPLPSRLGHLVRLRRAEALSWLAFQRGREQDRQGAARDAEGALRELSLVEPGQLAEEDGPARAAAALRVAASRWAAESAPSFSPTRPHLELRAGRAGETCLTLVAGGKPRVERCTWGVVWESSARARGQSIAVAVQLTESWTELWVFRLVRGAWRAGVVTPASAAPGVGYVEAAGFSPDGSRLLTVREAVVQGRLARRFEVRRIRDLHVVSWRSSPDELSAFSRWNDPDWRGSTLALR